MKIYESGESLCKQIRGEQNQNGKTYVCVVEEQGISLDEAFAKMQAELPKDLLSPLLTVVNPTELTVTTSTAKYTLAHERTFDKKGNIILTPSNLLRHLFTRNFTMDTLYIDENGDIVDMTDATSHIRDCYIASILPFNELVTYDNNALMETLYLKLVQGYVLSQDIENVLYQLPYTVKPLDGDNIWFNKLLTEGMYDTLNYMLGHSQIYRYLVNDSQLKLFGSFTPSPTAVMQREKSMKDFFIRSKDPAPLVKPAGRNPLGLKTRGDVRLQTGRRSNYQFTTINASDNSTVSSNESIANPRPDINPTEVQWISAVDPYNGSNKISEELVDPAVSQPSNSQYGLKYWDPIPKNVTPKNNEGILDAIKRQYDEIEIARNTRKISK